MGLALLTVGCASQSLMPREQAAAIRERDRALASHAPAIHAAIRQSDHLGALAFLEPTDGQLVVLPGDSPTDAWGRYIAAPPPVDSPAGRVSVPPVVTFVYRADVPKAPEAVTQLSLRERQEDRQAAEARTQALRSAFAALDAELRDEQRRTEERLTARIRDLQRELADWIAASRQETQESIGTARADMQGALAALADDLTAARRFMLQIAQLGWLNHELNVENANGIQTAAKASQALTSSSAKLADAMRQLSDDLIAQLKVLTERLENIQSTVDKIK